MNTIVDNSNISPPGQFDDEEMCHTNDLKDICLTKQNKTKQNNTIQSKAKQKKTKYNKTRRRKMNTIPDNSNTSPPGEDDKDGIGDDPDDIDTKENKLTLWEITALQAAYSTAGGIVSMPYMFGTFGYVLGPIVLALWLLLVYSIAAFVCDVVLASNGRCKHFSDVGYELGGKWGSWTIQILQIANMLIYLPTSLYTIAISIQAMFPLEYLHGCEGWWILIVSGILFIVSQVVKNFKESAWIAYATLALTITQSFILIPYGLVSHQDEYETKMSHDTGTSLDLGPSQPFGYPDPEWSIIAPSILTWVFTGTFILVETMANAEKPEEYKKALGYSTTIIYMLYFVPGLTVCLLWGWNFDYRINLDFENASTLAIILNSTALQNLLNYIMTSLIVNDLFRRQFVDNKQNKNEAAAAFPKTFIAGICHQLKITIPSLVFALAVAVAVPNIETVALLSTSITVIPTITWVLSIMWFISGGNKNEELLCENMNMKTINKNVIIHTISIVIGLAMTGIVLASSIDMIMSADFSGNHVWCGQDAFLLQ